MMPPCPTRLLSLLLVMGLAGSALAGPAQQQGRFERRTRRIMGTRFQIMAYVNNPTQSKALDHALDHVVLLERLWSPWIKGSDVEKVNRAAGRKAIHVSRKTLALLQRARAFCLKSGRAFDPTFFPLSPLYNFREKPFRPPTDKAVARVLPLVDCRKIRINPVQRTIFLTKKGMKLHLGGNAKGTALDVAARVLQQANIKRFFVDGGGDIIVKGQGPKGYWRVGVRNPRGKTGQLLAVLPLSGGAVATSGDYERFAIIEGKRYHHILDVRTGMPATGCASATVWVPPRKNAGELADSLATTLCVLGPEEGFKLLGTFPGVQAVIVTQKMRWVATDDFPVKRPLLLQPTKSSSP